MCEQCGNPDCPGDRFSPMPPHAFHQIMMMVMGDLAEKLTEQCIMQQRIKNGEELDAVVKEMEARDDIGQVGPRYILLAYKAAGCIIRVLEDEFNMKTYEENDELDALNQPKIQGRFWELLSDYMEKHHIIKDPTGGNTGEFSIEDLEAPKAMRNPDAPLRDGQQEAINQAVDEMIMKPKGKKEYIN